MPGLSQIEGPVLMRLLQGFAANIPSPEKSDAANLSGMVSLFGPGRRPAANAPLFAKTVETSPDAVTLHMAAEAAAKGMQIPGMLGNPDPVTLRMATEAAEKAAGGTKLKDLIDALSTAKPPKS